MWPEGKEYPVSWIRFEIGLGAWTIVFSNLIMSPVAMEVVKRRMAECLRARLSVYR